MSGQSTKKKRLGSRRTAKSRHETAEVTEFHVTDGTSVAQQRVAEESTESKSTLSDPDDSKLEIRRPASPEAPAIRRKLGSSRKLKGRQHVRDSEACLDPREEVEAIAWGSKTQEAARMSPTKQLEHQEEARQVHEHDISVAATTDHSSELEIHSPTVSPQQLMEVSSPKNENTPGALEEIKENLHGVETFGEELINNQPLNARDVAGQLSPKSENDSELRHLHSHHLVSESSTPKLTTGESRPAENVEVEYNLREVTISPLKEEFPAKEKHSERFNFSGPTNVVNKGYDEAFGQTLTQDVHQGDDFPHSWIPDASKNMQSWQTELENATNTEFSKYQHSEEFKEEVSGNTKVDEMPQTVTFALPTEMMHKGLNEGREIDHFVSELDSRAVISDSTPGYFHEAQNVLITNNPQTDQESLLHESESLREEKQTDFKVPDESVEDAMEASDEIHTLKSKGVGHDPDSGDVVNTESEEEDFRLKEGEEDDSTRSEETTQTFYSCESLLDDTLDADSETGPVNLTTSTHFDVKSAVESTANKGDSDPDYKLDEDHFELGQVYEVQNEVRQEVKHNTDLIVHFDEKDTVSERQKSPSQVLASELTDLDPQNQDNSSVDEQTVMDFSPAVTRRKIGSSRRRTARQQIEESGGKLSGDVDSDETEIQLTTEGRQESENNASHKATFSMSTLFYSPEVQNSSVTNSPGTYSERVNNDSEETGGERETDLDVSDKPEKNALEDPTKSDTLVSEVRGVYHSEDGVKTVQAVEATQIKQITRMLHTSENVSHDAAEPNNSSVIYGNLTDEAEIPNTSDLSVNNNDDLTTKTQNLTPDSEPDDKRDEEHTRQSHREDLDEKHEDYFVDDSNLQWINSTERGDAAVRDMYEADERSEGVEDSNEQAVDQDRVCSDVGNRHFSLQTSPSQLDSCDSRDQEHSPSGEEQTESVFNPITSRRKLGSSRRNRRKHQVGEPEVAVAESANNEDTPEMMTVPSEELNRKELRGSSEYDMILPVSHNTTEAVNSSVTNDQETHLESLTSLNVHVALDESASGFEVGEFDQAKATTMEELDQPDSPESRDVRGAHYSMDDEKEQPQTEQTMQIHPTSESVVDDAVASHDLREAEIRTTNQTEPMERNTCDIDPDGPQGEHDKGAMNSETSVQRDDHFGRRHPEKPEIREVERPETTPDLFDTIKGGVEEMFHLEKQETSPETEEEKSFSQHFPPETPVAPRPSDHPDGRDEEEEGDLSQGGNRRRKMASSRRHKGRHRGKDVVADSYDEPTEKANGESAETSETTELVSTIETPGLEASLETVLRGTDKCDTARAGEEKVQDESHACEMAVETSTETISPEEQTDALLSVDLETKFSWKDLQTIEEQPPDAEGSQHFEDTPMKDGKFEIMPAQLQDLAQDFSGCLINQYETSSTSQSGPAGNIYGDFLTEVTDSDLHTQQDPTKQENFESSEQTNIDKHDTETTQTTATERIHTTQGDTVSNAEKTIYWESKGLFSKTEDSDSSPQSLRSEVLPALDSQHQQSDTTLGPGGNRQNLGSGQEKSMETMLEGTDEADSSQTEYVIEEAKQDAHFSRHVHFSDFMDLTADRQQIQSDPSENPDGGLPTASSVPEIKKTDEDVEMSGLLPCNDLSADVRSECEAFSTTTEECSGRNSPRKREVVKEAFLSQQEMAKNGEHVEHITSSVSEPVQCNDNANNTHEEQTDAVRVQEIQNICDTLALDHDCLQATDTSASLESNNEEVQAEMKPTVNRKKLGSSRRHKRRQLVEDDATEAQCEPNMDYVKNTEGDKEPKTMLLVSEKTIQEESNNLKTAESETEIRSTENTIKLTGEDSIDMQFVVNKRASPTTDTIPALKDTDSLQTNTSSDKKDKKTTKEAANLQSDTVHEENTQLMESSMGRNDSYMQDVSTHDDKKSLSAENEDVLDLREAIGGLNTEVCSLSNDSLGHRMSVQQTTGVKETVDFEVTESSVDDQGPGRNEEEGDCQVSSKGNGAALETSALPQSVSVAKVATVDVSDNETEISAAMDAANSSESEQKNSALSETLQVKPKQKRRKLGSTRRSQRSAKPKEETVEGDTPESGFDTHAEVRNLDQLEVVEELLSGGGVSQSKNAPPLSCTDLKEAHQSCSAQDQEPELEGLSPDPQSSDGNAIQDINNLMSHQFEQSACRTVEAVNPATAFNVADLSDSERNVTAPIQPCQTDILADTEVQNTPGGHPGSPPNTQNDEYTGFAAGTLVSFIETTQDMHSEQKPEGAEETQEATKHEPNDDGEETPARNLNIRSSTNSRRKLGSTRRNHGSQTRTTHLHQTKEDIEATESETPVRDETVEGVPELEPERQRHTEDKDSGSEQEKEKVFETVERVHVGEIQFEPVVQQTVSKSQLEAEETERQLSPSHLPSTSETMSEVAPGGRRRKMGSHRKSRTSQNQKDVSAGTDPEKERRVIDITEEVEIKATEEHRDEPSQHEPSQVSGNDKEPWSSISEPSEDVSEKNPDRSPHAAVALTQGGPKHFSLAGNPGEGGQRSNGYNVVMIGDTSVGKTSFMKRAQSGKFSFDTPASVGMDSCLWKVVVDGKPVVLQVWDTAGQERFRSITRMVFHRAQAFLLMYDVSSSQSFSAVSYWATCIQESAPEDVIVLLLGNKSDCAERQVKTQQGEILATEYNFSFMECSAATGENVIQSLETVARLLNQRANPTNESTVLHKEPEQKKGSRCC